MPNVFDVDAAQKVIADVGKLTNELAVVEEKHRHIKAELQTKRVALKQLLIGPRKTRKPKDANQPATFRAAR